mmetsp:Transcript_37483/g.60413  ORF Transcript_37483/g.60413 Transcript_37483/m.60413 type:complete len:107 (-) Transcript_37483:234-554(-)
MALRRTVTISGTEACTSARVDCRRQYKLQGAARLHLKEYLVAARLVMCSSPNMVPGVKTNNVRGLPLIDADDEGVVEALAAFFSSDESMLPPVSEWPPIFKLDFCL